jgi:chromosome segregation ATPase
MVDPIRRTNVAKTIAELSGFCDILRERLNNAQVESNGLVADLRRLADALQADKIEAAGQRSQIAHLRKELDDERAAGRDRDRRLNELETTNARLKDRLDEYVRRADQWDGRRWNLVTILLGGALTLAGGVVVALVKK